MADKSTDRAKAAEPELDALDESEEFDDDEFVSRTKRRGRRSEPSQVYSLRIPVKHLRRLREVADEVGESPSGLMRRWVIERIEALPQISADAPVDVSVSAVGRAVHSYRYYFDVRTDITSHDVTGEVQLMKTLMNDSTKLMGSRRRAIETTQVLVR